MSDQPSSQPSSSSSHHGHPGAAPSPPSEPELQAISSTSSHPPPSKPDPTTAGAQHGAGQRGVAAPAPAGAAEQPGAALKRRLKGSLRQFPDFPSPGILFEDIMPLFADPALHADLITALELDVGARFGRPNVVVGLEARGFLFGPSLALRLGAGFVPVRKQGKLPGECETASYEKEYGTDFFQLQKASIKPGQKVLVVDDIIATGGSAAAAGKLVEQAGGVLVGYVFMMELDFLKGRDKLGAPVHTLLSSQETKAL